jgi:hypothetical protein
MVNLNPTELSWAKIKRTFHENNITGDLSLQKLLQVTKNTVALVTKEDWKGVCRHAETAEKQYWERAGIIPEVTDHIVINLNPGSDSDSEYENSDADPHSDCDSSEVDTEYSDTMPDECSDMELAQPL